jgi:hypothetical protein
MNACRLTLPLLLAALLLVACSRVTPDNYGRIEAGMTRAQVYEILGRPDSVEGGGLGNMELSVETWSSRRHRITVGFANGKVITRSIDSAARDGPY